MCSLRFRAGVSLLALLVSTMGCGMVGQSPRNSYAAGSRPARATGAPLPDETTMPPSGHAQSSAAPGELAANENDASPVRGTVLRSPSGGIITD